MRYGFATECVPRALAAATGISPMEAAKILWPLRTPPPGLTVSSAPWGAWPHDVAEALVRLGWFPELFDGRGVPFLGAPDYLAFLRARAHRTALRGSRPRPPATVRTQPPPGGWSYVTPPAVVRDGAPPQEQPVRRLTVGQWARTFPASTWIIYIRSHALCLRAGQIIEGGAEHTRHHVRDAIRVLDNHPLEEL